MCPTSDKSKVMRAIHKFEAAQREYDDVSAMDTEPGNIFREFVRRYIGAMREGRENEVMQKTADYLDNVHNPFSLYDTDPAAGKANNELSAVLREVMEALSEATVSEVREVENYL